MRSGRFSFHMTRSSLDPKLTIRSPTTIEATPSAIWPWLVQMGQGAIGHDSDRDRLGGDAWRHPSARRFGSSKLPDAKPPDRAHE